ncbi:MAG TPA: transcription/translation regulatory transformer protein RfaH [Gammaproteobacteria bacterium]|nr:transcription/translation regulatory transformer protein RfaH [Gammaproteobacteria bacterium]
MKRWYVIHAKPRQEDVAEENLARQGFEVYCPRIKREQIRRGRRVMVIEAMFPRYLFVCFESGQDNISSIRYTRGVSRLIRFGDELARVPDSVIRLLKESASDPSGMYIELLPEPKKGDRVSIVGGAFAGLSGVFYKKSGEERVIILLNFIGKQNKVTLKREQIALATL